MPPIVTAVSAQQGGTTERQLLIDALHACHWSGYRAALHVGVSYKTFYSRMQAHGIPTAAELNSFEFRGIYDTFNGHCKRYVVNSFEGRRRYRRGLPLEDVFWIGDNVSA